MHGIAAANTGFGRGEFKMCFQSWQEQWECVWMLMEHTLMITFLSPKYKTLILPELVFYVIRSHTTEQTTWMN